MVDESDDNWSKWTEEKVNTMKIKTTLCYLKHKIHHNNLRIKQYTFSTRLPMVLSNSVIQSSYHCLVSGSHI